MGAVEMLLIPADPARPVERVEHEPTLEKLQELVGGYIQMVQILPVAVMVLDEEGKLGLKALNERATLLARVYGRLLGDFVVGDVVVVGHDMQEDEYHPVPPGVVRSMELIENRTKASQ